MITAVSQYRTKHSLGLPSSPEGGLRLCSS